AKASDAKQSEKPAESKENARESASSEQPPSSSGSEPRVSIEPRVRPKASESSATDENDRRSASLRVDTTLVLINVSVTDPLNRFVTGLDREHFKLWEDNVEQKVTQFSSEDAPLSIGLVFDASGSMGSKLSKSRQAASQFFKLANPEDEFFLIQFNEQAELVVPFTTNTEEIQNRLTFTQAKGRTALLDGVYMAMNQMKKARNPRKAILILSDGGDNSSRYTESEIRRLVREADVQVYAMGIFEPIAGRGRTAEELSGPGLLSELAEQTGGRHFPVDNINELPDVAAKIGMELRNQYVLGYSPTNQQKDGKYRKVKVKLQQLRGLPPLRAVYRVGYYAPLQ
ncbi:MAG TPA: VWA domain-containing protein, partial [Bryobacteraceae bacterium]|nr:VWA domain-containing protein [Bryobacteraceae bacterium]